MSTLNTIVDEILLDLSSYGLSTPRLTSLALDIDADDTTVKVTSATNVPVGLIEIDSELMYVQSVDRDANTVTVIRGFRSTAATHTAGALVTVNPPWPRKQVANAVNDAITSSYPQLFKVATTALEAKSVDNTYDLSAGRVLQVRNLTTGPTTE